MMQLATIQLLDTDYFWHLKTGEYIYTHFALPHGDIFSFTQLGKPWVLHEWLFEVSLYAIFKWLGPMGVKFLVASLATTALAISYSLLKRLAVSPFVAFALLLASYSPFSMGISPRPQLVSYLFFTCFIYVLLCYKYFDSRKSLLALPLIMIIWVNAHAGYMLGLALVGIFLVCEWGNYWIAAIHNRGEKNNLIWLSKIALFTALSSLFNPWFISHWLYPFQVLGMHSLQMISEWQSPNFNEWVFRLYLILVFLFFVVNIYKNKKPDLTEVIIPVVLITLGFVSIRNVPLAVLTLVLFIAKAISREHITWLSGLLMRIGVSGFYKKWIGGGKQLGSSEAFLNWMLFISIAIGLSIWYPIHHKHDEELANKLIPIKATEFVAYSGIYGRMFNSYNFGGYLIYQLYPIHQVFIDGRVDMYGDDFFKEYLKIIGIQPGWEVAFDKFNIDYIITERNEPLSQLLQAHGEFRLVYDDQYNSVLLRNIPRYAHLIQRYGH
jgi:hypothetical protein